MLSSLCLRRDGIFFDLKNTKVLRKKAKIMSKIKFQNFIFTLMTVILMAYCMIVYSVAINSSVGLVNQTFLIALKEISN